MINYELLSFLLKKVRNYDIILKAGIVTYTIPHMNCYELKDNYLFIYSTNDEKNDVKIPIEEITMIGVQEKKI